MQWQAGSCFCPFQHSCWFQALGYTGISPGFGCSCGLTLPALGPSLSALHPLCTSRGLGRFSSSTSPQSQVPCPFHATTSSICCLMSSCPGCPTRDVTWRHPLCPALWLPFLPLPPAVVSLFSSLFSFLFCFLSLWQGPTVRCILPDPPAPLTSQRPPRRRWRRTCKDC